jgi:hypothetical protein
LTSEENVTAAAKKNIPISDSSAIIAPLQDAVDLKIATDSKKKRVSWYGRNIESFLIALTHLLHQI